MSLTLLDVLGDNEEVGNWISNHEEHNDMTEDTQN